MKHIVLLLVIVFSINVASAEQILFTNVKVFDGVNDGLQELDVLVEDKLIKQVARNISGPQGATIIDGGGRTLMPGLIDSHVHFYLSMDGARPGMETSRWDYFPAMGAGAAQEWFADGFTTVRDAGGMHDGLRKVIDAGLLDGPRMYLAGGMLSQSPGHGTWCRQGRATPITATW